MANTPNMSLPIDVPGSTAGPAWATDLEAAKLLLDVHTHVSGLGVQVPTAGLNINATLPYGGYGASNVGPFAYANQATTSSGTANLFYASAGNIYWNNASGVPIQITSANALNVASVGGITGLSGTTGAWTYSAALKTFIGTADTNKSAALDVGATTIRETNVTNSNGVTLTAPAGLAASYALTFPANVSSSGVAIIKTTGAIEIGAIQYNVMPRRAFSVYRSASQLGVASGAAATLFADTVVLDTDGGWNAQQGIYTIPRDGDWEFDYAMGFLAPVLSGTYLTGLVINSGSLAPPYPSVIGNSVLIPGATGAPEVILPARYTMMGAKAGDKVKVILGNDLGGFVSGSPTVTLTTGSGFNYFQGRQVG